MTLARPSFFKSLRKACRGLVRVFAEERNFRIHTVVGVGVLGLAWWLRLPAGNVAVVVFLVAAILLLELLNTVVERVVDALAPRLSYLVRDVKDMMAGAVLLGSLAAVGVGILIFGPPLWVMVCDTLFLCTAQTL